MYSCDGRLRFAHVVRILTCGISSCPSDMHHAHSCEVPDGAVSSIVVCLRPVCKAKIARIYSGLRHPVGEARPWKDIAGCDAAQQVGSRSTNQRVHVVRQAAVTQAEEEPCCEQGGDVCFFPHRCWWRYSEAKDRLWRQSRGIRSSSRLDRSE